MSDVVVVGAGVFGAWTAHYLSHAGARVTLLDAYGAGNSRSSSGDESRILRCGYGADEIYSRLAWQSRAAWRELDARADRDPPLWHPCGVLWLAPDGNPYVAQTLATLEGGGYPVESFDRDRLRERYPQLDTRDVTHAMFEPEAGVIMARRAVQALVAELSRKGVTVRRARAEKPPTPGVVSTLRLHDGTTVAGDLFVFACGAWLPSVFPELLGSRIVPTRQVVMYFGPTPGDDRFTPSHMPAWVDFHSGLYGVPDIEGRGLKVGIDAHGARFDPDTSDRTIDETSVETARAWLARRLPALVDAPLVEGRVCQYENTASGDFLIDRHPDHPNVWLAGGGSGHGFKHGPAVGEHVAGLIAGAIDPISRFALSTKGTTPRRAVY